MSGPLEQELIKRSFPTDALKKATSIQAQPTSPLKESARSLIEFIIESLGSNETITNSLFDTAPMIPDDRSFLRQFLHPDKDIFPVQSERPTKLNKLPNLPFKQIAQDEGTTFNNLSAVLNPTSGEINLWDNRKSPFTKHAYIPGQSALGEHVTSFGRDETGPYMSLYDIWDFDSPVVGKTIGKLLNNLGQPYAVYNRYPLEHINTIPNTPGPSQLNMKDVSSPFLEVYKFKP